MVGLYNSRAVLLTRDEKIKVPNPSKDSIGRGHSPNVTFINPHLASRPTALSLGGDLTEASTSDSIVKLLSVADRISAKEVYFKISKRYGKRITYRAVHKALTELHVKGVLSKDERLYSLSLDWIRSLKDFAERIEKSRSEGKTSDLLNACEINGGSYVATFKKAMDLDRLLNGIFTSRTGQLVCTETYHLWWVMFYPREMLTGQKFETVNNNIYTICRGDSAVDRWCAGVENDLGMHTKTGVDCAKNHNTLICGDYVVIYTYPEEVTAPLEKAYAKIKNIGVKERRALYSLMNDIFNRDSNIAVTVLKNPQLAERMRGSILREHSDEPSSKSAVAVSQ